MTFGALCCGVFACGTIGYLSIVAGELRRGGTTGLRAAVARTLERTPAMPGMRPELRPAVSVALGAVAGGAGGMVPVAVRVAGGI